MFGFIKKILITALAFVSFETLNAISLKCVSTSNQRCM